MRDGVNPEVQLAPPPARPNTVFPIELFCLAGRMSDSRVGTGAKLGVRRQRDDQDRGIGGHPTIHFRPPCRVVV
jgi:hypothetical protein